jgi:D-alanine--poly(phosphoribitol) ligase subunit 1
MKPFTEILQQSFIQHAEKKALCINNTFYTYSQFAEKIKSIQNIILNHTKKQKQIIALHTSDDIETYASILACWFSGCAFVPLNPNHPEVRNQNILEQTGAILISPTGEKTDPDIRQDDKSLIEVVPVEKNDLMCILFTSGSTGIPKGVPMNRGNIDCTMDAFFALDYNLTSDDGFLQMFDFGFDMSMLSYLPAFMLGACVYTVSEQKIRYLAALKVMQDHPVTFAAMVPSTLTFLQPFFSKMALPRLRFSVLGGEPFYKDIFTGWAPCIPNARIINISGPSEITMACMGYELSRKEENKHYNGVLAFGSPWKNTTALVVDEQLKPVPAGMQGELCFAGNHVMAGYWKIPEKNKEVFFNFDSGSGLQRFYRTGDMAIRDNDDIFLSCGRIDQQVKIQGHKVELGEIEHHVRTLTGSSKVAAIAHNNDSGLREITIFVDESIVLKNDEIMRNLQKIVPVYMLPSRIIRIKDFPSNNSGKTDRIALTKLL